MQRIKKGDTVEVIAGKDLGVRGEVLRVLPKEDRVIIKGVNIVKKHEKARMRGAQQIPAQIVATEAPIHLSNAMFVCPKCSQASRVGFRLNAEGNKLRFCKKCNAETE
jgi:large subunit ribosomal protein L24